MNEGPERIDYRETSDVTEVHAAIQREHAEPRADVTPIPLWLTIVCGVAICWAGAYLGVFHGGFSPNIFNEYQSSPVALFPLPDKGGKAKGDKEELTLVAQGKVVYAQCQGCHMPAGQGQPIIPPLANSEYVVGSEKRLAAILLKGITGPLTVAGKQYNNTMPGWEATLSDKKLAAVASYIRASWGNNAGEISEGKMAAARKEFAAQKQPFTEAQILEIPADAALEDAGGTAQPASAPKTGAQPAVAAVPGASAVTPAVPPPPATAAAQPTQASAAAPAGGPGVDPAQIAEGKKAYMATCVACHQPNGLGLPGVFPTLSKTEYVLGSAERFAAMILKGNAGPMTIEGKLYNNIMPGQEAMLDDAKVAAIMTYVRSSFGNKASAVTAELVAATRKKFADRKTPWTEAELKDWKDDAQGAPPSGPGTGAPPTPATPGAIPASAPSSRPEQPKDGAGAAPAAGTSAPGSTSVAPAGGAAQAPSGGTPTPAPTPQPAPAAPGTPANPPAQ